MQSLNLQELLGWLERLIVIAVMALTAAGVAWPFVRVIFPSLWATAVRAVVERIPDKRMARAVELLGHAVGIAAPQAINKFFEELQKAQKPDSDGGATVTPEEWVRIMESFSVVGMKALEDEKALDQAAEPFGGKEALKAAIMGKLKQEVLGAASDAGVEIPMGVQTAKPA